MQKLIRSGDDMANKQNNVTRQSMLGNILKCWELYLLLLPAILYYILFQYAPMYGIVVAFKKLTIRGGILHSPWIGFEYFNQLFQDPAFWAALRNTVIIGIYKLIFFFPVPIIIAIFLNEMANEKFKRVVQTVIYLPRFISWTIMSGIIINILSVNGGVLNNVITGLFKTEPINFLMNAGTFRGLLVITTILKDAGWGSIIYIAALTSINPELYEACVVDGGGRWKQIWNITLPGLRPIISIMLILSIGSILSQDATQVLTLYSPNVFDKGDILGTYVYRVGIEYGRFSFATAAGLFNSVISLFLILIANKFSKTVGENGLF